MTCLRGHPRLQRPRAGPVATIHAIMWQDLSACVLVERPGARRSYKTPPLHTEVLTARGPHCRRSWSEVLGPHCWRPSRRSPHQTRTEPWPVGGACGLCVASRRCSIVHPGAPFRGPHSEKSPLPERSSRKKVLTRPLTATSNSESLVSHLHIL